MMIKVVLLPLLLLPFLSRGQDSSRVSRTAFAKCASVGSASYIAEAIQLPLFSTDTMHMRWEASFQRLPNDAVCGNAFHIRYSLQGQYMLDKLFTGSHFVKYYETDSSGTVYPVSLYADYIKNHLAGGQLYGMLDPDFRKDFFSKKDVNTVHYFGIEQVGSFSCYRYRYTHEYIISPTNNPEPLRRTIDLWVNRADSFPVKYAILTTYATTKDTIHSYEAVALKSYSLDSVRDTHLFTMSSIPPYYRLTEYSPGEPQKMLVPGSEAPAWSLSTVDGREVKLKDLRGRIVLIDFFYKACLPCGAAIPMLVDLDRQYRDKGLSIVGVDSYDKNDQSLKDFIKSKEMAYPILLNATKMDGAYHVSGYPTLYLIDKEGRILYSSVGFTQRDRDRLEEEIENGLAQAPDLKRN